MLECAYLFLIFQLDDRVNAHHLPVVPFAGCAVPFFDGLQALPLEVRNVVAVVLARCVINAVSPRRQLSDTLEAVLDMVCSRLSGPRGDTPDLAYGAHKFKESVFLQGNGDVCERR